MGALLNGIDSDVWVTSTPSTSVGGTPESCTDTGDHTVYQAATHTAWDRTKTFTVQCSPNGSTGWATVTDYTMAWPLGKITFDTARQVGTDNYVRISAGYYFNLTQLDEAHTWSLSEKANIQDTTPFQASGGFKRKTVTTKEATGNFDTFRTDDALFTELGNPVVIWLYIDKSAGIAKAFFGYITGVEPKGSSSAVLEQTATFEASGPVYFVNP